MYCTILIARKREKPDVLVNPLFANEDDKPEPRKPDAGHAFRHRKGKTIQPISQDLVAPHTSLTPVHPQAKVHDPSGVRNPAVELIRNKLDSIYAAEPDVRQELAEVVQAPKPLSKHQQFMQTLSTSGKSLADIQTEWHAYYAALPDQEKHTVWQEFYQAYNQHPSAYTQYVTQQATEQQKASKAEKSKHRNKKLRSKVHVREYLPVQNFAAKRDRRSSGKIRKQILNKVQLSEATQAKAKQHVQSLMFGVGTGIVVLIIFLFGFFNEMFIAPFIQPSRHVSATPIIVNSDSVAATDTPEILIPKINVQIPVVYDEKSSKEEDVQQALERGILHYPTTVLPGQQGNASFFGHSSNNIFNKGKYKFAFVLLHELVPGDIFYLTYDKKVYSYKVYDKKIVPPSEVSVLDNVPGKLATATLITCDPPGTSTNRLVVWGEQISPDPSGAAQATPPSTENTPTSLPSEGPTMWSRFWSWIF